MPSTVVTALAALTIALILKMVDFQALIASARVTLFASSNKSGVAFDPARDMPSLAGKVILVTGGAGDLGKQVAIEFARHKPARIYIADLPHDDGGASVIRAIRDAISDAHAPPICYLDVDLSSFESIRTAVAKFCAAEDRLDIAVLNAGIMRVRSGTTTEGYEIAFGINYLGHALLMKLLMATLLRTAELPGADVRVVAVSSEGHNLAPKGGILFDKLKGPCEDIVSFRERERERDGAETRLADATAHLPRHTISVTARAKWPSSASLGNWRSDIPRSKWLLCIQAASSQGWHAGCRRRASFLEPRRPSLLSSACPPPLACGITFGRPRRPM